MKYLIDTCVVSDFVRGDESTMARIKETRPSELAISSVSVMELNYGLKLNSRRAKKLNLIISHLLKSINILDFTEKDAYHAAEIRAYLKKKGTPIGWYDVLIAGTAVSYNLIMVTANHKEFSRVSSLPIENWRSR